jgi:hypothetical protein
MGVFIDESNKGSWEPGVESPVFEHHALANKRLNDGWCVFGSEYDQSD